MHPQPSLQQNRLLPHCTGVLEINTRAIAQNYRTLSSQLSKGICAAVVKADAYGFGMEKVASVLHQTGCRHFFVSHSEEALVLRTSLPEASLYVFSGLLPGTEEVFVQNNLIPVLNDFGMVERWSQTAQKQNKKLPCVLHIDTGMRRNGFDSQDVAKLFASFDILAPLDVKIVMSHLVSSHEKENPLNEAQKKEFEAFRTQFPHAKASLADTGGIYLDPAFHYDIARPGKGLFGLYPSPSLVPCLKVLGRILQIRTAYKGESVGYGATHTLTRDSKLATLGIGFADGYDRRLSQGYAEIQGFKAPVVGRISMDYTVIDVTDIPEEVCYASGWADLVNERLTLDALAHQIGTISRELSTGFGQRLLRVYC